MNIDKIIEEHEPIITQQEELYTREQVVKMLTDCGKLNAEEWLKNELLTNEKFKQEYTRNLILQLRYCLPFPAFNASFEEFSNHVSWSTNVSVSTAERLVRLISTGDANKQRNEL